MAEKGSFEMSITKSEWTRKTSAVQLSFTVKDEIS